MVADPHDEEGDDDRHDGVQVPDARAGQHRAADHAHRDEDVGAGVGRVYLSNDIDGADPMYAPATGAPEPGGLTPGFVRQLIRRLGERFALAGGDL
ncbi:MAG: arginase family protein, partial [Gemmatimonadota bacterium]